ncbi:MAG: NAD(P) transhydrogenase subunit alpha [Cyclobacteriaceae bacterium]|nr:NAD(P) transhydrogenase subunit alpha [Cyclobacteriaceae bacterium]
MVIGVLKSKNDTLVALVPKVITKLINEEAQILIETEAGLKSNYKDSAYEEVGAKIVSRSEIFSDSDIILTFSDIEVEEVPLINKEAYLIGKFNTGIDSELKTAFITNETNVFDLDLLPRSTIAQSMDVLSALASLSGYKAVVLAADNYSGYFPMMTTSAGTVPPAKVMILGAGVAGLQAIATARRLGGSVEAFDVRSSVKEEVQSLGARFIEVEGAQEDTKAGGYAIEQSEEYIQKQKELIHQTAIKADVVITSANIPNKKAPLLIEKRTIEQMKPGSVVIDMASATGGNVELSENNKSIEINGVRIIGDSRLFNQMGTQASHFYANNLYNFLKFTFKDGFAGIPYESEIVSKTLLQIKEKISTVN